MRFRMNYLHEHKFVLEIDLRTQIWISIITTNSYWFLVLKLKNAIREKTKHTHTYSCTYPVLLRSGMFLVASKRRVLRNRIITYADIYFSLNWFLIHIVDLIRTSEFQLAQKRDKCELDYILAPIPLSTASSRGNPPACKKKKLLREYCRFFRWEVLLLDAEART